ncbi:hypothetical protein B0H13DRAFT_2341019 [Mycena leptocephala]|nr:hypothetical protein B0H13DRAFT_2341019 [Mycena leptocephala]
MCGHGHADPASEGPRQTASSHYKGVAPIQAPRGTPIYKLIRMNITHFHDTDLPREQQHWQLDWMYGGLIMAIYLGPALGSGVIPALIPDRNHDIPELKYLHTLTEVVPVKADMELKGSWDPEGVFVVEWLRGMIKDHTPESAAIQFSLNPDKFHWFPDILDSITQFNYFLHLHGREPIPKVGLEMHTLEGPFENRKVSGDIFSNKVAEVKDGEKYGFTMCNGSPYALFVSLLYFDPERCSIQAWYSSKTPLPASPDGVEATRLPIGYGPGVRAFEFKLSPGKTVDSGFLKLFVSTEQLDVDWIEQMSPFNRDVQPSAGRLAGAHEMEGMQVWDVIDAVITMRI